MAFEVSEYDYMKVSVFGNSDLDKDSLMVRLMPELRERFPGVEFKVEDPVEGLKPPKKGIWVILDVVEGIEGVKVIEKIDRLVEIRRVSLHDYDVGMELKLLKKLGKIGEVKIVVVGMEMEEKKALGGIVKKLKEIIPKELHQRC